jgi:hypothetical protein
MEVLAVGFVGRRTENKTVSTREYVSYMGKGN